MSYRETCGTHGYCPEHHCSHCYGEGSARQGYGWPVVGPVRVVSNVDGSGRARTEYQPAPLQRCPHCHGTGLKEGLEDRQFEEE